MFAAASLILVLAVLAVAVHGSTLQLECAWNGYPMCCGLVKPSEDDAYYPRPFPVPAAPSSLGSTGASSLTGFHSNREHKCKLTKTYVPSKYELQHMEQARKMSQMSFPVESGKELTKFVAADVEDSNRWLSRVKAHMSNAEVEPTADDFKYLSYFNVTKSCSHGSIETHHSMIEWIEPITVHARHPFRFIGFSDMLKNAVANSGIQMRHSSGDAEDMDYIIIKSGRQLEHEKKVLKSEMPPRHYLFDAGANMFHTGMYWFVCAYLQRKIVFDEVYGWEYVNLDPVKFWEDVPPSLLPHYHFYNAPVSSGAADAQSVTRFLRQVAREQDFVAFKLDIDNSDIEIPIAVRLLKEQGLYDLVDEFFFELHFKCEVMRDCCWGKRIPDELGGLKLDRFSALTYFQSLRKLGIRAHIWV